MLAELIEIRRIDKEEHVRLLTRDTCDQFADSAVSGRVDLSRYLRCSHMSPLFILIRIKTLHMAQSYIVLKIKISIIVLLQSCQNMRMSVSPPVISLYKERRMVIM